MTLWNKYKIPKNAQILNKIDFLLLQDFYMATINDPVGFKKIYTNDLKTCRHITFICNQFAIAIYCQRLFVE